jgi:hypothetical protein
LFSLRRGGAVKKRRRELIQLRRILCVVIAGFTKSFNEDIYLGGGISLREFYFRGDHVVKTESVAATIADKMNMMIVMMTFRTVIFTKGIEHGVIISGNCVYDAFFYKSL